MDHLRFRFWDEENQKWLYFGFNTYLTYQDKIERALADGLTIYQSTGLTDQTGKVIYAGDKVNASGKVYTVIFEDGGFSLLGKTINCEAQHWITDDMTIVGNVKEGIKNEILV